MVSQNRLVISACIGVLAATCVASTVGAQQAWPAQARQLAQPIDQTADGETTESRTSARFKEVLDPNVLPASEIRATAQDAQGFVWIATIGGLARWDGTAVDFYTADPSDEMSLPQFTINDVIDDPNRGVWVAAGTLVYFDPWTREVWDSGIAASRIARDGESIWIHDGSAVGEFDLNRRELIERDPVAVSREDGHDVDIAIGRDGQIYASTDRGVVIVDPGDTSGGFHTEVLPRGSMGITMRAAGGIWAASPSGLWIVDLKQDSQPRRVETSSPRAIALDPGLGLLETSDGKVWVGGAAGSIGVFDPVTAIWSVRTSAETLLPATAVHLLFEPAPGAVMAAPFGAGIHALRATRGEVGTLRPTDASSEVAGINVLDLHRDGDTLWVATDGSGLHRINLSSGEWSESVLEHDETIPTSLPSDSVIGLAPAADGGLWIGAWDGGLSHLDPKTSEVASVPAVLSKNVFDVVEGPDDEIWIAAWDVGVQRLTSTARPLGVYGPSGDILTANDRPIVIIPGTDKVWIGGWAGLELVDLSTGTVRRWSSETGELIGETIFDLYETEPSKRGSAVVWLATSAGLERLDPTTGQTKYFGRAAQLPGVQALQIEPHETSAAFWVATNNGLALFDQETEKVTGIWGTEDGLASSSFARYGSARTDDGTLYLATNDGVAVVAPDIEAGVVKEMPAYIVSVKVDGENVDALKPIEVSRDSTVRIDFRLPSFISPARMRYQYRLGGVDNGWVEAEQGVTSVTYSELRGGSLDFQVRALGPGLGSQSRESFTVDGVDVSGLQLEVQPALFQRPLVLVIAALGLLAAGGAITNRRRVVAVRRAQELEHLVAVRSDALGKAVLAAKGANEAKSKFLSMISHELRSPLSAILGFAELIHSETAEKAAKRWADRVLSAGEHLEHLIEDLISAARSEQLFAERSLSVVSLSEFLEETCALSTAAAELLSPIEISLDPALAENYVLEELRLRQVLLNLLDNALTFGHPHPVLVNVDLCDADPRSRSDRVATRDVVRFAVSNSGAVISSEDADRLFDPFVQLGDAEQSRQRPGLGLGLSISAQIVESLGGSIEVESEEGAVTIFSFSIGLDRPTDSLPGPISTGKQVLVVDDEPTSRQLLVETLSTKGYSVVQAASGQVALEMIESIEPVAVVTDFLMPGMTGGELAKRLRSMPSLSGVPIISVSAVKESAKAVAEFDRILAKPLRPRLLVETLGELLNPPKT